MPICAYPVPNPFGRTPCPYLRPCPVHGKQPYNLSEKQRAAEAASRAFEQSLDSHDASARLAMRVRAGDVPTAPSASPAPRLSLFDPWEDAA